MSKPVRPFKFKQFTIEHDKCAMKVGFDGALLGVWANHSAVNSILDIGTGSGLIALILRQRFPGSKITALEPNTSAFKQAQINFGNSPFEKDIELVESNLQSFTCDHKFDMILSNPPFFTEETGSDNLDRNEARQEKFLPLNELMKGAKNFLSENGHFFLIYPTWEAKRVIDEVEKLNLFITIQTTIFSKKEKPSKRTIFQIQKSPCTTTRNDFTSGNQDIGYSPEYRELMKEFYTIF